MENFSPACERNKQPILAILKEEFVSCKNALEIGSGSGQHALFFAEQLPQLNWQPSELQNNFDALAHNLGEVALDNLAPPIILDVGDEQWPIKNVDAVFTANTLHIMSWPLSEYFFNGIENVTNSGAVLCVYGPFRYQGKYTSPSNETFDLMLKQRDMQSGIREFEAVNGLAEKHGFVLKSDYDMPANNQLLVWRKT